MSKLRTLATPLTAVLLGLLASAPAQAVYLQSEAASEPSIGELLASFFAHFGSFFAANNGSVVP